MARRMRVSILKAAISAVLLVLWCVIGVLIMLFAKVFRLAWTESFPMAFHRMVCKLFSLRCEITGKLSNDKPTLYVVNHISYLDVFILGGLLRGAFVAKTEIASWPVFGTLAKFQSTLFLERNARRAAEQIKTLRNHLLGKGSLILFPEGTSTGGSRVAPFRSSLFAAADDLTVQPVTIAYVAYEGLSMTQEERDRYAWYIPNPAEHPATPNRPFISHFFSAMGLGPCLVKIHFHEPVRKPVGDRKAFALRCETTVRRGLDQLLEPKSANDATAELTVTT